MSEMAARDMTTDEWADRIVGKGRDDIAIALAAAEARGKRAGLRAMRAAADHFETAYRYAVNAHSPGADAADMLASAETMAGIGYDEMRRAKE